MSWEAGESSEQTGRLEKAGSKLEQGEQGGRLERAGSKLEWDWKLERAGSKLGVSWSEGSKLGGWRELGVSWEARES